MAGPTKSSATSSQKPYWDFRVTSNKLLHLLAKGTGVATRQYPLLTGSGRIARTRIFCSLANHLDDEEWVDLRHGYGVFVSPKELVGRVIYYFGDIDPKVSAVIRAYLREGDTFVDVGANLGYETVVGARIVGSGGQVIAFEPQPNLVSKIKRTIAKCELKNVAVCAHALGDQAGEVFLTLFDNNSGAASILSGIGGESKVQVAVKKGAEVLGDLGVARVDLIKIDVEGFESRVLFGMNEYFESGHVSAVLFECNRDFSSQNVDECKHSLNEWGFDQYAILRSYLKPRLASISDADSHGMKYNDIFAIHRSAVGRIGRIKSWIEK